MREKTDHWGKALYHQEPHLHGGEVAYAVKLKHDFDISTGEALISPAHEVVPGPHVVDVTVCKIIQATHSVSQLAQTLSHTEKQREADTQRNIIYVQSKDFCYSFFAIAKTQKTGSCGGIIETSM